MSDYEEQQKQSRRSFLKRIGLGMVAAAVTAPTAIALTVEEETAEKTGLVCDAIFGEPVDCALPPVPSLKTYLIPSKGGVVDMSELEGFIDHMHTALECVIVKGDLGESGLDYLIHDPEVVLEFHDAKMSLGYDAVERINFPMESVVR